MFKTHIYLAVDSVTPRETVKKYAYILAMDGKRKTIGHHGSSKGTYHNVVLIAVLDALGRFTQNCEITIHSEDCYVLGMLQNNLDHWEENGYMTARGKPVRDADLWKQIQKYRKFQKILVEPGTHKYCEDLQKEMERRKESELETEEKAI